MPVRDKSDPKDWLTFLEIGVLMATVIWVFAFMQADLNKHEQTLEIHDEKIQNNMKMIHRQKIDQAVTNEQYKQIIEQLEKIDKKIDNKIERYESR